MLMYDWGITYSEFISTPVEIIEKMRLYRQATSIGKKEAQNQNK
jgi:hypothetical protein